MWLFKETILKYKRYTCELKKCLIIPPKKKNQLMWFYASVSRSVVSNSLQPHGLYPARLLCPWGFSRQEYWSGLPCPFTGDLPTQGLNPGLLHCRQILCHLSHQGSPMQSIYIYVFIYIYTIHTCACICPLYTLTM